MQVPSFIKKLYTFSHLCDCISEVTASFCWQKQEINQKKGNKILFSIFLLPP